MGNLEWKAACLKTVEEQGEKLCDWETVCVPIQEWIDGYCGANKEAPGTPVPQGGQPGGICFCCCSCFAYDTPIEVSHKAFAPIQEIELGQNVMAASVDASGNLNWDEKQVTLSNGLGGSTKETQLHFNTIFHLAYTIGKETRVMLVTADHLFMMSNGKLRPVQTLQKASKIKTSDGGEAEVVFCVKGEYDGGLHHISLGAFDGNDINGHLINANGLVSSDYEVQIAYASGTYDPDTLDAGVATDPEVGSKEYQMRNFSTEEATFCSNPSTWPRGFVPNVNESAFNVPETAMRFLTQAQEDILLEHGDFSTPLNNMIINDAYYLFDLYQAFFEDCIFLLDWNNDAPNAYAWNYAGQKMLLVTGGLMRFVGLNIPGMSVVMAHLVAAINGESCVADADYQATYIVMRQAFRNTQYVIVNDGIGEITTLFDIIMHYEGDADTTDICRNPGLDCRLLALSAGASMSGPPDCAIEPVEFGILSVQPEQSKSRITIWFDQIVDIPTAETVANYTITLTEEVGEEKPESVEIKNATVIGKTPNGVRLHCKGLVADENYTLIVKNVISASGDPLSEGNNTSEFET